MKKKPPTSPSPSLLPSSTNTITNLEVTITVHLPSEVQA